MADKEKDLELIDEEKLEAVTGGEYYPFLSELLEYLSHGGGAGNGSMVEPERRLPFSE